MKFRYSYISMNQQCSYKYYLSQVLGYTTIFNCEPANPLVVGNLFHHGLDIGPKKAIYDYYMNYPVINDLHINEVIKFEYLYPKIINFIHTNFIGEYEKELELNVDLGADKYNGTIDLVAHNSDGTVDLIDYKYSNNIQNYSKVGQLHVYKYFYEKQYNKKVRNLYFLFIPKTSIRQKKTENIYQFRKRLYSTLSELEINLVKIDYDYNKVIDFIVGCKDILSKNEYEKNETRLCDWCEFQDYCQKNIDYAIIKKEELNMLPSSARKVIGEKSKRKIWLYGKPFSGKTTMLDAAPNPLNLNTDGNIEFVTMPDLPIRDKIEVNGRITTRTFAWQVFKDAISELEKKQNDFKTIILDLLEDGYESCRLYMYDKQGIAHESDDPFAAWDIIRTEYLSTMRRFFSLDYENLIIISHEDSSKDVTKKSGSKITKIAPNLQEKICNKIAGMVDIVARVVIEDDGSRTLNFKSDEVIFGGGRLKTNITRVPLDWNEFVKVYEDSRKNAHSINAEIKEEKPVRKEEDEVKEEVKEEKPAKRTIKVKEEVKPDEIKEEIKEENEQKEENAENSSGNTEENKPDNEEVKEEKPARRTRKAR